MSEQLVPETRNRSRERSKTPFHLRSQCAGENCTEVGHVHGPTKKSPTVTTIVEEPESPAINHKTSTNSVTITRNVAYSMKTIESASSQTNNNQNSIQASLSSTNSNLTIPAAAATTSSSSSSTSTSTKVQTKSNQNTSSQRTVLKSKRILGGRTEVKDNILNKAHEDLHNAKHSTPKQSAVNISRLSSPNILENINLNDHLAYKEYKEAGEYWKKYPKTDYVYSPTYSPFRREIKPGVIAMPNMSRRSLDQHQNRINEMAFSNPAEESFIRRRYQSHYEKVQNFNNASDQSQDELDEVNGYDYRRSIYQRRETVQTSIVRRFFTSIITFITAIWCRTCSVFGGGETDYRSVRYTRHNENKGFFSRVASAIKSAFVSIFRYIYLIIASIQFWDSCFLQSSSASNRGKKRFLLLLLLLLPLLLLAGLFRYYEKPLPITNAITSSTSAFSDYINDYVYLDNVKAITYNQYGNAKNFSLDLFLYLKDLSENYAREVKHVWTEKFGT